MRTKCYSVSARPRRSVHVRYERGLLLCVRSVGLSVCPLVLNRLILTSALDISETIQHALGDYSWNTTRKLHSQIDWATCKKWKAGGWHFWPNVQHSTCVPDSAAHNPNHNPKPNPTDHTNHTLLTLTVSELLVKNEQPGSVLVLSTWCFDDRMCSSRVLWPFWYLGPELTVGNLSWPMWPITPVTYDPETYDLWPTDTA